MKLRIALVLVGFVFVSLTFISPAIATVASFQGLGDLAGGSFYSKAYGVSSDGSVVVGVSNSASGTEAFRWTSASGMVGLGDLSSGIFFSWAYSVSADGSTVVGISRSASGYEAFRWTSGGMVGLGDLPGGIFVSYAFGVSSDGSVVVGRGYSASGSEAFRWTSASGMVGLGDLAGGSFNSWAYGVSSDGSVVVGWSVSASGDEAFRWTSASGMVGLGDLAGGSFGSEAYGVSSDGSVVVGWSNSASGGRAFIWDAINGMHSLSDVLVNDFGLDLTGWTLTSARGISDDGLTIVGYGNNPSGNSEAWIATIPEPAMLLLVEIDIKPGSCPNPLNVKSSGVLPVAVLGSADVNVLDIDPTSIAFSIGDVNVGAIRCGYEDVAAPVSDSNDCNCTTEGPDGFLDLTLKFKTQKIVEAIGDVNDGDVLTLELTGVLYDPPPYETHIEGADCIVVVGKHKPLNKADINKDGVVNMTDFALMTENWLQSSIVDE